MSSELRRHCTLISLLKSYFWDWSPQLPVQLSTEFTRTETLNSEPILFFDGTCHKAKSQTNHHPSIDHHIHRGQPLPPSILLISTCDLTPSLHSVCYYPWYFWKINHKWINRQISCIKKLCQKQYLRSSSTNSTPGAPKKIGSKMLHPQKHKNLMEVNGVSSLFLDDLKSKRKHHRINLLLLRFW